MSPGLVQSFRYQEACRRTRGMTVGIKADGGHQEREEEEGGRKREREGEREKNDAQNTEFTHIENRYGIYIPQCFLATKISGESLFIS